MPSLKTAISLATSGELVELIRRIKAYTYRKPLIFPKDLEIRPALRAQLNETTPARLNNAKVLFAGPSFSREGAPISQFELVLGLAKHLKLDIVNIALRDGPLKSVYLERGLNIDTFPYFPESMAIPKIYEKGVEKLAAKLSGNFDLIYANTVDMFPVIDAAQIAGIPSIWNIRESEPWRERLGDRHPRIAERAIACFTYPKAVIFVAESSRKAWSALETHGNFHVIPNSLRPDGFVSKLGDCNRNDIREKIGVNSDEKIILSVGTICERKRQYDSIKAFTNLDENIAQKLHWVFLGREDPKEKAKLEKLIPSRLKNRIHFLGSVENPSSYYKAADIFVSASQYEAMPRTLLEAIAAKIPIITTPEFGAKELFIDGKTALFFDVKNYVKLAKQIQRLTVNSELGSELVVNAYHRVSSTYSDMIQKYSAHFNAALLRDNSCVE